MLGRLALLVALLFLPAVAAAQDHPWTADLAAARRAFGEGRFAQAAERAARAQAQGFVDEAPPDALEAAWRTDRAEIGCMWGLSALAAGAPDERIDALDRVSAYCAPLQRAVAAHLAGDPLEAALRLEGAAFPAPFTHLTLPSAALDFARATHGETLPPPRDLDEARRFVRAHAAARHGLDTECSPPRGFDWLPRRDIPMTWTYDESWVDDEDEALATPPAPFAGAAPGLTLITCSTGPAIAPEDRGFGDGRSVVVYVLARRDTDVRVVGSFVGFPMLDCWTGVVQASIETVAIPGTTLIRFVDREGYVTDSGGPGFVAEYTTICDTERGGCRTVPTAFWRNELLFDEHDDTAEPTVSHTEWHGELVVDGGLIHLTESRSAPRLLRALGRPMRIAHFLAAPTISGAEQALFPDADPRPAMSDEACPWEVADPDGITNLRAVPGSGGGLIGTVPSGTVVVPVERRGRWWRIESPAGWLWAPNLRQRCP